MVEIGSVIDATVTQIETYGVFLKHGDEVVLVLIPEFSWAPVHDLRKVVQIGELRKVFVLGYHYPKKQIVGSFRRLQQEENPYRELSRLPPDMVLNGKITFAGGDDYTVKLPNGAWGGLPKRHVGSGLHVGDAIPVRIHFLDVDQGRLLFSPVAGLPNAGNGETHELPLESIP